MQHHPHHQPQGHAPTQQQQQHLQQHQQHPRPSSVVHQQHHPQAQSQQHPSYASAGHPIAPAYQQQQSQPSNAQQQHSQDGLPYYAHPSPYSTPGATSGYTSAADQSDMMAAAQMPRPPYPPMSYHTPQSNSPASVASPSQHDQHRSIYGQPPSQPLQQHMYYQTPQAHYPSMQAQPQQSPYAQHQAQTHQSMSSQPNMMMSAQSQQQQQHMPQHQAQQHQAQMTNSPRGQMKTEPQVPLQLQKPQTTPMQHQQHPQNGAALNTPTGSTPGGVNPNAAPGPIPATTPLVVRQDQNGVQWIAFEYSRDRVKMEYTIRCDVESVNTDELSAEFKTENCVYPRACCPKDQYRGNRQVYETECNTVGWALAQLNPPLRGKRGLIQRAVDSWRNSNQDPRLRSRRVRRMAKMNTRKSVQGGPHPAHMGGPSPPGMAQGAGGMGPAGASAKMPGMNMGHMPHTNAPGGGDEVGMFHQM
ncbi:ribosomal protein L24E [Colletotrichum abscissum]|nr:ribosomal protein L24E [Colletotrichum abscissum]KAK1477827.1 ribosomal protein L24E [Colletotrichum abscissum]